MAAILIIDDDPDDAEFLTDAFRNCGQHTIHHALTATDAFHYLEAIPHAGALPDVVISDNLLPGKTGLEFMTELKKTDRYSSIPVILLSSTRSENDIIRFKEMGAMEYITKPAGFDEYLKMASFIQNKLTG